MYIFPLDPLPLVRTSSAEGSSGGTGTIPFPTSLESSRVAGP